MTRAAGCLRTGSGPRVWARGRAQDVLGASPAHALKRLADRWCGRERRVPHRHGRGGNGCFLWRQTRAAHRARPAPLVGAACCRWAGTAAWAGAGCPGAAAAGPWPAPRRSGSKHGRPRTPSRTSPNDGHVPKRNRSVNQLFVFTLSSHTKKDPTPHQDQHTCPSQASRAPTYVLTQIVHAVTDEGE